MQRKTRQCRTVPCRTWGFALCVLACATPVLAQTEGGGLHFGLRGGVANTSIDSARLTQELRSRGHHVTASVDDSSAAFNFYVAKRLSRHFALELGYLNIDEHDARVSGTTTQSADQLAQDVMQAQAKTGNAVSLMGRWQIPISGERVFLMPRAGAFWWRSEADVVTGSGTRSFSDDGLGFAAGLGLDFAVTPALHLGLGWELLRPDSQGSESLLFGQVEFHLMRR
jgi:opacity protein-like surface antigen